MAFTTEAVVHRSKNSPVETQEQEIPSQLSPNQVVVKTEYASINPVDVKLHSITFRNKPFHTLKDFSGTVAAVGSAAQEKFPVGEKVYGCIYRPSDLSYVGTYTLADLDRGDSVGKLPPKLSFEEAAGLGAVYGTAYQMLERANDLKPLTADSRVLVLGGATSVGTLVIELAKYYYGVKQVVATCSPTSAEYVQGFGAETINYRVENLSAEFQNFVKSQGGAKFDAILDCVGGYDALRVSNDILKPSSEGSSYISILGDAPPAHTYAATMLGAITSMPRSLFRSSFGKYYGINYSIFLLTPGKWTDEAYTIFDIPGMRIPIDSVTPLKDIQTAWEKVDSTKARGKVIVKMQE